MLVLISHYEHICTVTQTVSISENGAREIHTDCLCCENAVIFKGVYFYNALLLPSLFLFFFTLFPP